MKLRDYQVDLIDRVRSGFARGKKRILAVLPCGAGKTVCFADMARRHVLKVESPNTWFLVHRVELIDQTRDTFAQHGIPVDNIFVGMVQTVSRRLDTLPRPSLIIFDEAHHAKAKTWYRIIEKYHDVPTIGLTATPVRLDGESLGDIFDDLAVGVDPETLIDQGYLSKYEYYAPPVTDLEFQLKGTDYDLDEFTAQLLKSKIYGEIGQYIDPNKKTIIYAPSIAFSKMLEQRFGAVHFDGSTPYKQRREIVRRFKSGRIKLITNVDLIGEGFDVPDCESVILLRPTRSLGLFIQQSSRCLRPQPGKVAKIYDLVGNVYRHGMPTEKHEWSLSEKKRIRNSSGEPDVIVRRCKNCLLVYPGVEAECPYCHHQNGKTRQQIEHDERVELERIEKIEKKKARQEVGRARTVEELIAIGTRRGYKNPVYWARMIIASRKKRI